MTADRYTEFYSLANKDWRIGFKKKLGKALPGYADNKREACFKFQKVDHSLYSQAASTAIKPHRQSMNFDRIYSELHHTDSAAQVTAEGRKRAKQRRRDRRRQTRHRDPVGDNT